MFYLLSWTFVVSNPQVSKLALVRRFAIYLLQTFVLTSWQNSASFTHIFESCLKFGKSRGYIKIIYLVKLKVKPALELFLPKLLCCYQKKSYQPREQIHNTFWSWNCSFLEVVHIFSILWKDETKHYSILLMFLRHMTLKKTIIVSKNKL